MSTIKAESRRFTPFDLLLVAGVVALAVFLIMSSIARAGGRGETAAIEVNGRVLMTVSLSENRDIQVPGFTGESHIRVQDGEIWMVDSDCPDKICVGAGAISHANRNIVCMPNRVVIRIEGPGAVDTVSQ